MCIILEKLGIGTNITFLREGPRQVMDAEVHRMSVELDPSSAVDERTNVALTGTDASRGGKT